MVAKRVRKRFYVLRLISAFYKFLAIIIGLVVIVAVTAVTWAYVQSSSFSNTGLVGLFVAQVFAAIFSGGLTGLTFWVIASLIDLLINIDHKIDILTVNVLRQMEEPTTKTDEIEGFLERVKAKL
jgi:hypothetical protein